MHLTAPSSEDRSLFFDRLIEAALSVQSEDVIKDSLRSEDLPELAKAPKVDAGPKASELRAKAETQGHALRRLRMCFRDVCNRLASVFYLISVVCICGMLLLMHPLRDQCTVVDIAVLFNFVYV